MTKKDEEPEKSDKGKFVVIDTGRFREFERMFKELTAASVEAQKTEPPQANTNAPYLVTVIVMMVIGVAGVTTIVTLRADFDILIVAGVVFAFLTPTTTSILSFMKAQETNRQARDTHLAVNSRLDAFMKSAGEAEFAKGEKVGRRESEARADNLARK